MGYVDDEPSSRFCFCMPTLGIDLFLTVYLMWYTYSVSKKRKLTTDADATSAGAEAQGKRVPAIFFSDGGWWRTRSGMVEEITAARGSQKDWRGH